MKEYSVTRCLILAAALAATALSVPAATTAHTPTASVRCEDDGLASLTVDLVAYNGQNTVSVDVDGHELYSQGFGDAFHSVNHVGSGYYSHSVTVVVRAHDDPTGEHGWSKVFQLDAPACKHRVLPPPKKPSASINGPCADPQYRGTFRNPTNHTVAGELVWRSGGLLRLWHHSHVDVPAHSTVRTSYKHVLQFTTIRARVDGVTLASERAARGGWYGACPA